MAAALLAQLALAETAVPAATVLGSAAQVAVAAVAAALMLNRPQRAQRALARTAVLVALVLVDLVAVRPELQTAATGPAAAAAAAVTETLLHQMARVVLAELASSNGQPRRVAQRLDPAAAVVVVVDRSLRSARRQEQVDFMALAVAVAAGREQRRSEPVQAAGTASSWSSTRKRLGMRSAA